MKDIDMVLFKNIEDKYTVTDLHSATYSTPTADKVQNWQIMKPVGKWFIVERELESSYDYTDYKFDLDTKFKVGFAKYQASSAEELIDKLPYH